MSTTPKGKQDFDNLVFKPETVVGYFGDFEVIFKSQKQTQSMKEYYVELEKFKELCNGFLTIARS